MTFTIKIYEGLSKKFSEIEVDKEEMDNLIQRKIQVGEIVFSEYLVGSITHKCILDICISDNLMRGNGIKI